MGGGRRRRPGHCAPLLPALLSGTASLCSVSSSQRGMLRAGPGRGKLDRPDRVCSPAPPPSTSWIREQQGHFRAHVGCKQRCCCPRTLEQGSAPPSSQGRRRALYGPLQVPGAALPGPAHVEPRPGARVGEGRCSPAPSSHKGQGRALPPRDRQRAAANGTRGARPTAS